MPNKLYCFCDFNTFNDLKTNTYIILGWPDGQLVCGYALSYRSCLVLFLSWSCLLLLHRSQNGNVVCRKTKQTKQHTFNFLLWEASSSHFPATADYASSGVSSSLPVAFICYHLKRKRRDCMSLCIIHIKIQLSRNIPFIKNEYFSVGFLCSAAEFSSGHDRFAQREK